MVNPLPRRREHERGASMIGLLLVVLILGIMAAVAVSAVGGGGPVGRPSAVPTTSSGSTAGEIDAALRAACEADYETLSVALQVYQTLHSHLPPAGSAWVAGIQSGTQLVQAWPGDPGHFSFSWNGVVLRVIPRHGAVAVGSVGNSASGCDATLR